MTADIIPFDRTRSQVARDILEAAGVAHTRQTVIDPPMDMRPGNFDPTDQDQVDGEAWGMSYADALEKAWEIRTTLREPKREAVYIPPMPVEWCEGFTPYDARRKPVQLVPWILAGVALAAILTMIPAAWLL